MDVAPFISNGRVYVPIRYLTYALEIPDSGVSWNPSTQAVTLTNGSTTLTVTVGSRILMVNGVGRTMDVSPVIVDGRTMLPARWVAEPFGAGVKWVPGLQNVVIQTSVPVPPAPPTPATGITTENYNWSADGYSDTWSVNIPNALLQYNDWLVSVWEWYGGLDANDYRLAYPLMPDTLKNWLTDMSKSEYDLAPLVTDELNYQFEGNLASSMAKTLSTGGISQIQEVDLVAGLVQSLPYNEPQDFQLGATTLAKGGDCKAKSELLAGLLKQLGFQVVLLSFPPDEFSNHVGHVAVGVSMPAASMTAGGVYYNLNGVSYYYLETTYPGWHLGQLPTSQNTVPGQGVDLTGKKAYVYPIQ